MWWVLEIISHGEDWFRLLEDRNLTSHVYNKKVADQIVAEILGHHFQLLIQLEETLKHK